MAKSFQDVATRAAVTIFVIALLALIVFGASRFIPKAERPTLTDRPGTSVVSPTP